MGHQRHLLPIHHLRDGEQPVPVRRLAEVLEPLLTEPLERVGGSAGLEGAASQDLGAGLLHSMSCFQYLFATLDGAGTGHHHHLVAPDPDFAEVDHRVFRVERPAGKLERLAHPYNFVNSGQKFKLSGVQLGGVANDAQDGPLHALRAVDAVASAHQLAFHGVDLLSRSSFVHYDHHHRTSVPRSPAAV